MDLGGIGEHCNLAAYCVDIATAVSALTEGDGGEHVPGNSGQDFGD